MKMAHSRVAVACSACIGGANAFVLLSPTALSLVPLRHARSPHCRIAPMSQARRGREYLGVEKAPRTSGQWTMQSKPAVATPSDTPVDADALLNVNCDGKGLCVLSDEPACVPGEDGEEICLPGPDGDWAASGPAKYWAPRLILLGCCVLYGTNFAFGRLLNDSLSPSVICGLRFSLAAAVLSPALKDIERELIRPAILCSLLVALGYVGQAVSLETISAGKSGFICSLSVITCPLLESLVDGRRIGAPLMAAIALSIGGVAALELGGIDPPGAGDLWAMTQPIGFGAAFFKTNAMMRKFPRQTLPITAVQVAGVCIISLVWMLVEAWHKDNLDISLVEPLLRDHHVAMELVYIGIVSTALTCIGETKALGSVSSGDASILMTTEPLWAAVFGALLMGESLGANAWVGGALILSACLVNTFDDAKIESLKARLGFGA